MSEQIYYKSHLILKLSACRSDTQVNPVHVVRSHLSQKGGSSGKASELYLRGAISILGRDTD